MCVCVLAGARREPFGPLLSAKAVYLRSGKCAILVNLAKYQMQSFLGRNCVCMCVSRSVVSSSLRPHRMEPAWLLRPWDSLGQNTGVGSHFLLQRNFPTHGSNPGLLHRQQSLPFELQGNQGETETSYLGDFLPICLFY